MERIGRYKIVAELGRGAMGVVYKAQDPTIGRPVAIKTIRLGELVQPEEREQLRSRLFREAQSAGILSHPGIVTIYDIAEESNLAYITMEYVEGHTLEKMLDTGVVNDAKYLVSIATQTAVALDYAHTKGIIHRDIKPGNIMVNTEGQVKITDFGIARIASSKFTHTGTVMGTPSYMSPEQVRGATVDGRSDMFSLAVVLYEMLTGEKPFTGDSITTVIFKIVSENPVPPKELNASVGNKVNAVVMRALAKEPAERYQSCKQLAEALQLAVAQTDNLTPTIRKIPGLYLATESGDPGLMTQPAERVTPVEEAAPKPQPAATPLRAVTPIQVGSPAIASPVVSEGSAPTVIEKKLPPLEVKPARVEPVPAARAVEPPPRRRSGLTIAVVVALALVASGAWVFWQKGQTPWTGPEAIPSSTPDPAQPSSPPPPPSQSIPPVEKASAPPVSTSTSPPAAAETRPGEPPPLKTGRPVINVVTTEPGARVVVDGNQETACTTPCSIPARAGRHNVTLTQAGFHPVIRDVVVGNTPVDLQVSMRSILGTVYLSTDPPGATITIDGNPVEGETPKTLKLPLGSHRITVTKGGAGSAQSTVEVTEDALQTVKLTLQP